MIERTRGPRPLAAIVVPMEQSTNSEEARRFPSVREAILIAIAIAASLWLVARAEGAAALVLTFSGLVGLHLVFLLGRARSGDKATAGSSKILDEQLALVLAEKERTELLSLKKSEFMASVSHEIRTAMTGIISMAELLMETDLAPDQRDYARTVHTSAKGLLTVLSDIQDYSKIETGRLALKEHEFRLRPCIEGVADLLYPHAHERGLELILQFAPSAPEKLIGDEGRVQQVLLNLIGNAVKFTDRGWIRVDVETRNPGEQGLTLVVRVSDTGVGIPADRKDLFQPFGRIASGSKHGSTGAGLGLAIAQRLACLMGGGLAVESEEGVGSTFTFSAPLRAGAPEEPVDMAACLRGKSALVVDSSDEVRSSIRSYLEGWGLSVAEAATAQEALGILERSRSTPPGFQFVIVDRNPSGLSGLELAARIKNELGLSSARLVLTSTFGRLEKPSVMVRAGFDAWICKPVSDRRLMTALIHVSDESLALPEEATKEVAAAGGSQQPKVLLVEDNLVNQKVMALALRKLGLQVETVSNGHASVAAVSQKRYAAVLMDCQMPSMDGFEATKRIRELPHGDVPIIALTASAMTSDRERCFAAGMNDYLSKPVELAQLERMMGKWVVDEYVEGSPSEEPMEERMAEVAVNKEVLEALRDLGGEDDPGLFSELINMFLSDTPERMRSLSEALDRGDTGAIERAAHALKSSAANLGALELSDLFREIEAAGRDRDLTRAKPLVAQMHPEYERVEAALRSEID